VRVLDPRLLRAARPARVLLAVVQAGLLARNITGAAD